MARNIYADALQVQNASNLSGVVKSWAEAMEPIWAEARALGKGTDYVNTHPVNVLFAEQVYHLTGYSSSYSSAYAQCKAKEASAVSPRTNQALVDAAREAQGLNSPV